jgi:hypothetical protein
MTRFGKRFEIRRLPSAEQMVLFETWRGQLQSSDR